MAVPAGLEGRGATRLQFSWIAVSPSHCCVQIQCLIPSLSWHPRCAMGTAAPGGRWRAVGAGLESRGATRFQLGWVPVSASLRADPMSHPQLLLASQVCHGHRGPWRQTEGHGAGLAGRGTKRLKRSGIPLSPWHFCLLIQCVIPSLCRHPRCVMGTAAPGGRWRDTG